MISWEAMRPAEARGRLFLAPRQADLQIARKLSPDFAALCFSCASRLKARTRLSIKHAVTSQRIQPEQLFPMPLLLRLLQLLHFRSQRGDNDEQVTYDPVIGKLEDGCFRVLVDGDDVLG